MRAGKGGFLCHKPNAPVATGDHEKHNQVRMHAQGLEFHGGSAGKRGERGAITPEDTKMASNG